MLFGRLTLLLLACLSLCDTQCLAFPFEREAKKPSLKVNKAGLKAFKQLLEQTHSRAAIVMGKDKVVAEWYWGGASADTVFEVWSVSKSFASTCIGLLIDEGKIGGLSDPVGKYVPSWNSGLKVQVTIEHLLRQTSGLRERGNYIRAYDQLGAALDADIITTPGAISRYNNAGCNVLSAVISAAAGKDPEAYMREKVWKPIGMDHTSWRRDGKGNVMTYAGIQTSARDLARFGQLFLNKGKWNGKRVLSKKWVEMATRPNGEMRIGNMQAGSYGLLWWVDQGRGPHNFSALGFFGNNLTVIPELGLVGVRLVGTDAKGLPLMMMIPMWANMLGRTVQTKPKL